MTLSPGTRLGPYEVVAQIGAGGMGEVYRAIDTKLKRQVALKVLPAKLAADRERLARFQREAEVLASLNHPNIAAIYGLEDADGIRALIMELVGGLTLAEQIEQGPIPVQQTLAVAKQIAEALEAAHERGIIHRDLKPANIKIRPDGVVRVLDFGLAKTVEPPSLVSTVSQSPTITTPAMTQQGMILGTAAYMAPEQAKGHPAGKQSDVWAFGCVLYEMLTGTRAFPGATTAEVLSNVLKVDPSWPELPQHVPVSLRSLLGLCLQKEESRRLRHIGDAALLIEQARSETSTPTVTTRSARQPATRERLLWAAAIVIITGAAIAWSARGDSSRNGADEVRLEINVPPTTDPSSLAISPDGRTIAFQAHTDGQSQLWVRTLGGVTARPLAGTEGGRFPFWSPDSRSVGFSAFDQLKRIDVEQGTVQVIAAGGALGGAWNRDGTIVYDPGPGGALFRVASEGGARHAVTVATQAANDHFFPQFLPDHLHFLFYATGSAPGIYIGRLGVVDPPRRLVDAQTATYAAGQLLFVRDRTLFAQPFDAERLELHGTPVAIAGEIVGASGDLTKPAALSAAAAGTLVYRTGVADAQHHLVWFDRSGTALEAVPGSEFGGSFYSSLSPDGTQVAVSRTAGTSDIWVLDVKRGVRSRLTFDTAFDLVPVWSPDGRHIAFTSNRLGPTPEFALYMKEVGATPDRDELLLAKGSETVPPTDWSRDGRFILYASGPGDGQRDVWALSIATRKSIPVAATPFNESNAQFSPDGHWIAYQSNESGRLEVYVQPFPGPGAKVQISTAGGVQPRWRRDGMELFYLAPDNRLMAVPLRAGTHSSNLDVGAPVALFAPPLAGVPQNDTARQYAVSPDGQRFLVDILKEVTMPITVVLNRKPVPE